MLLEESGSALRKLFITNSKRLINHLLMVYLGAKNVSAFVIVKGSPPYTGPKISFHIKQTPDSPTIQPSPIVSKHCFDKVL